MTRRIAAVIILMTLVYPPTVKADPQCWSRYDRANSADCGGNPNAPGSFPGAGGGQSSGGLLGGLGKVLGGLTGGLL